MSMVPLRMQMYDPMPLRLGPTIKPPPPPLRMPQPPQHDWSCGMPSDGQATKSGAEAQSPLDLLGGLTEAIVKQLKDAPKLPDCAASEETFRQFLSGTGACRLTPELMNPISGELVSYVPGLLGYARVENSELVNVIKFTPYLAPTAERGQAERIDQELLNLLQMNEAQIAARVRAKAFMQECAARGLEPAKWFTHAQSPLAGPPAPGNPL